MSRGVGHALRQLHRRLAQADPADLVLRLTLLDLLLRPIGDWTIRPLVLALAALGLLVPGWLRRPEIWLLLVGLTGLRVILDWPLADNHAYLLSYWCLAIFLSLTVPDTAGSLALNGRWLIGLVFAFATLWKTVSPDYLDGTFFRVTLLMDGRFEDLTRLVGGMTPELLESHRAALARHADALLGEPTPGPIQPARFVWLARFATLWTLGTEAAVALAFLWPLGRGLSRVRHAVLLVFCATTYAVATVEGFGWLLVAMGMAQCEPERRVTRSLYLVAFFLILFYREVPWASLLVAGLSPAG